MVEMRIACTLPNVDISSLKPMQKIEQIFYCSVHDLADAQKTIQILSIYNWLIRNKTLLKAKYDDEMDFYETVQAIGYKDGVSDILWWIQTFDEEKREWVDCTDEVDIDFESDYLYEIFDDNIDEIKNCLIDKKHIMCQK